MDNITTPVLENPDTQVVATAEPAATTVAQPSEFSWKSNLNPDFANSPTIKNFPDTKDGFNSAVKSHLELQKLVGYEKVPIPKGPQDTLAMDAFKKAFKIPDKAEGYALPDPVVPDNMKDVLKFDKSLFQNTIHKHNLNPEQAKGLWNDFQEINKQQVVDYTQQLQNQVAESRKALMGEWGDAYQSKVELGQMVINKYSSDQDMNDFITSTLVKDPRGVKFLAKIGDQLSENKIGDFKYQRHSLTPEEIDRELSSIRSDMSHPYNNEKAPFADRERAIKHVNGLIASRARIGQA